MNAPIRNLAGQTTVEDWKLRSLIRIVAEDRDPHWKDDGWFRDLAAQLGVDLTSADIRNPGRAA